jgi:hypothetical protein
MYAIYSIPRESILTYHQSGSTGGLILVERTHDQKSCVEAGIPRVTSQNVDHRVPDNEGFKECSPWVASPCGGERGSLLCLPQKITNELKRGFQQSRKKLIPPSVDSGHFPLAHFSYKKIFVRYTASYMNSL